MEKDSKGEGCMEILQRIKEEYGFNEVVMQENNIISTEVGRKKINFWQDQNLLDWHIKWRDWCNQSPNILTDRVYQTKSGKKEVAWEGGWFTLHDEVTTLYPMTKKEAVWGELFASMITFGEKEDSRQIEEEKRKGIPDLLAEQQRIVQSKKLAKNTKKIIYSCIQEGVRTAQKASALLEEQTSAMPVLDRMDSTKQGKAVFNHLFWQGSACLPKEGFADFVQLLNNWLLENGEASVRKLLEEIDKRCHFKKTYGKMLLAEALMPWELAAYLSSIEKVEGEERDATELHLFQAFQAKWDARRKLVICLCDWLENNRNREKVAT